MEVPVSALSVKLETLVVGLAAVDGDSAELCVGQPGSANDRMPLCPIAWCWSLQRAGRQNNTAALSDTARARGGGGAAGPGRALGARPGPARPGSSRPRSPTRPRGRSTAGGRAAVLRGTARGGTCSDPARPPRCSRGPARKGTASGSLCGRARSRPQPGLGAGLAATLGGFRAPRAGLRAGNGRGRGSRPRGTAL